MGQYADKTMTCRDCGKQFTFTAGEQEFYAQRGFSEPGRCGECRAARKAGRDGGGDYSGRSSYNASSYGSADGGSYGSSSRGAGTATGTRQMFTAICADCGATTEVPFEPRQGRPVYCRDCFERRSPRG